MQAAAVAAVAGGFKMLDNGCSWYETNRLGGCLRLAAPRPECLALARHTLASSGGGEPGHEGHSLAVIMPYRGAGGVDDLRDLCAILPTHLARLGIRHRLYLVRQIDDLPFNRGALVNAAVRLLARGQPGLTSGFDFDYLAVHDIDRFPVQAGRATDAGSATHAGSAAHAGSATPTGIVTACSNATAEYYSFPLPSPRVLHPLSLAGGVLIIQRSHYEAVNGFSNEYWGWGEEDNDLFLRLRWCGWAPRHGPHLDACMEHQDCPLCVKQKLTLDPAELRAHEGRVREQLENAARHLDPAYDGLFTVNFTLRGRNRRRCGHHSVHMLSVELRRVAATPIYTSRNGRLAGT
jgi:hypothetical protein